MTNTPRTHARLGRVGIAVVALATVGWSTTAHATDPPSALRHPAEPGPGQTERISFSPGTDNATRTGVLSPGQEDRYVLRAGAGQTMTVNVSSSDVALSAGVYAPDGAELSVQPNSQFNGQLPSTGDYVVVVGGAANVTIDVSYTLTVRIPATPSTCGTTRRIQFAPGTDHATVSGSFCEGQDNRFVLRAAAGQTMTVSGIEAGTAFSVVAPDGSTLPGGPGEVISFALPASGDYTISHGPRRSEGSTFEFTVTIPRLGEGSPTPAPATRVQFPAGTFGTSLRDSVSAGDVDRFVLWAAAGHRMAIHVDAAADNATLTITAPDGTVLSSGQTQPTIERLPASGDYTVEVHPNGGSAAYQISFWIR